MKRVALQEISINITDGKHGDCEAADNSGYYFVSCKDIKDGEIDYLNSRQITEKDFQEANKRTQLEPNDILITNSGTIGRMALVKDIPETYRTTFQKSVAIIKPNSSIVNPRYLYYKLQNCVNDFINSANGSAQKNLLLRTMRNFSIDLHEDLLEQDKLASILTTYDDLIENNQKQIKLLEEAAQRLYKEWFVDLRFPGYETTPIVDGVPEGWEKRTVGDLIGKSHRTAQIMTKDYLDEGAIPVIDQSREFIAGYTNNIDSLVDIGKPVIVFGDHTRILKYITFPFAKGADGTQLIVSDNDRMPQPLLYCSLVNVDLSNYHYARHFKYLKAEEILVPEKAIAEKFTQFTDPIYIQIQVLRDKITKSAKIRDSLLPKLMNGENEV